jgi:AcrR family transcriptional regulator
MPTAVTEPAFARERRRHVQIESAALELFAERGFAAVGIRDIARKVGVVSSALYHYVGTKDELLASIMRRGLSLSIEAAREASELVEAPESRVALLVQTHIALQLHDPRTSNVIDGEVRSLTGPARDEIVGLRDAYEAIWTGVIDAGLATGVFEAADGKLARLSLLEMCNGVSRWYTPRGRADVVRLATAAADLALGALRAWRDGGPVRLEDLSLPSPESVVGLVARVAGEA